ncbi:MAG TPA: penicillin-binding protein 2 [Candidatus Omnitrophota bacterium]|nr:penicillin-binding protein 2 [Candidatus Omnitrophota bacterium]
MRLKSFKVIITFSFIILIVGLGYTQIFQGEYYQQLSVSNCIRVVPVHSNRGRILDRNGIALADTLAAFDVLVIPQELQDRDELFSFLGSVLGFGQGRIDAIYQRKRTASFAPVVIAEDVPREKAIILEENKFRFPGLLVQVRSRRHYPFGEAGAHVLGYVAKMSQERIERLKEYGYTIDGVMGYSGIEEQYDQMLRGVNGGLQIEVNNRGQQVRVLGMKVAHPGEDVMTTLDARIQQIAQTLMREQRGVIIVMNLDDGAILGMVSAPSFDPNDFASEAASNNRVRYFTDTRAPLFNRAIRGQYPPGSVFKIPVAIAGLYTKKINPHTTFVCHGSYTLGNRAFRCSHTHGAQDFTQGLGHSCNVYFFNTGLIIGPKLMEEYARLFGLGVFTKIDLPYEERGHVPHPDGFRARRWSKGDTLNFSIGQGDLLVTPIQIVNMIATVARDGRQIQPYIAQSIGAHAQPQGQVARVIHLPKNILDQVKEGLRAAVAGEGGTARAVFMKDLLVLGKTGTAQSSGNQEHHAWFVGYCPSAKTRIAFCVFLEYGGSSYNACRVSAQLLKEMKALEIL